MKTKITLKRRVRGIIVLTLVPALIAFAAACSKNSNTGNSSSSTNSTSPTTKPAGSMSPTDTLKAYYDAAKKKDLETVKKYLSHGTMQTMEEIAKSQGKTVDQLFKEGADRDAQMPTPEFSNEKINGETATIDIKAPGQPLVIMQMVKEGGEWKLAIDKMMKEMKPAAPAEHGSPAENDNEDEGGDNSNH